MTRVVQSSRPWPIYGAFAGQPPVLALCCAARPGVAQTVTTGNLAGTVRDAQGGVLPGVDDHGGPHGDRHQVRGGHRRAGPLQHPERPRRRLRRPRGDGGLPRSRQQAGIEVALGEREPVDFRLQIAAVTETVEVVGRRRRSSTRRSPARATTSRTRSRRRCRPSPAASPTSCASARCSTRRAAAPATARRWCRWRATASATTPSRSTARPTTTCSGWRDRRARPAARRKRSRSASTPSRKSSWSSRPTTCVRAASPAAASTPSRRAARTRSAGRRSTSAATRDWVGEGADDRADLRVQGQAGRLQPRRSDRPEQGVLLRHRGLRPQAAADRASRSNSGGQQFGNEADVNRVLNILQNRYGYRSGPDPLGEFGKATDSDKYFVADRLQPRAATTS